MVFVFRSLRNTVAPATTFEPLSTTVPSTTRSPMFCANAGGGLKSHIAGTTPSSKTANTAPAGAFPAIPLTLLPLPLQTVLLRRPGRHPPAPTPAVLRRPPRTPFRIPHRRQHRLLPIRPIQRLDHSRIQGSWAWQPPLFPGRFIF